jgi:hypothetical protein
VVKDALIADFTEEHYQTLLDLAAASYEFEPFGTVSDRRHVLWRHDVDFSVHRAVALAELEHKAGLKSTFFLLLHSEFYNILERRVLDLARQLPLMGHWVGLHFDVGFYGPSVSASELEGHASRERRQLEDLIDAPIDCCSFHNPELTGAMALDGDGIAGMTNAYGAGIRDRYRYVSDSNGYWRFHRLADVISEAPERLHVLTHPGWWQREAMTPHARVERCISGRADATRRHYRQILADGNRIDVGAPEEVQ